LNSRASAGDARRPRSGVRLAGRMLGPEDFSGGEAPGQANFVLRELDFTVEKKNAGSVVELTEGASERGRAW
jgi:hypothetical protein